jgi:S1-C subfamily serine protease
MSRKQVIVIIIIAFFVGALGSLVINRFLIPYLATIKGWESLNKLATSSPIVINRTQTVQFNDGVDLLDLTKQASNVTVSFYRGTKPQLTFAGLGVLMSSDGLIFTSKTVVGTNTQMTVVLNDGSSYQGLVRAADPKSDLAVVTIQAPNLPTVQLGSGFGLQSTQRLISAGIGNKEFLRQVETAQVSNPAANNRFLDQNYSSEQLSDSFGTSFVFTSNFAGAPIMDLNGKLVGLVGNDHGEIIIAENLQTGLSSYLSSGKIIRPKLGLLYSSLTALQASLKNFNKPGVVVLAADAGSPAQKAGLLPNDLIYEVDGQSLADKSFEQILNSHAITDMNVKLLRAGKDMQIKINLEATK